MNCCKKLSCYFIDRISSCISKTQAGFTLLLCCLSLSANAQVQFLSFEDNRHTFIVGFSLPIIIYCLWRLLRRFFIKPEQPTHGVNISQDELHSYTYDATTNLPTAQFALKQFERALKADKQTRMAAIVFKPINFQQVNTVLGRHNSDILLLQLAYCLQKKISDNKQLLIFDHSPEPIRLARLQSLDFLVVFDFSSTKHEVKYVIDDLCKQLASAVPEAMSFKSFSLNFELAFGVALSEEHGRSVNEIVSHATDALSHAESTEQSIQYFDNSAILYTEQQLALMELLRQDIIEENLHWYLQPQVNLVNHHIVGFELTVHWHNNTGKPLELFDFIDLAEHSGEVYRLTKQMFLQAFNALSRLHQMGIYQKVSVSLSSKNLLEADLVDFIEQQMQQLNISGKYLMIELDEQVMLSACQRAKTIIDQLKTLDIEIAIANFSGSYESLRYLRKLAIHQVKINCQQLGRHEKSRTDKAIINALITLTRSMSIPLIGSHIINNEAAKDYMAMGGELIQGDMIHSGIEPEGVEAWLAKWFIQHPAAKPAANDK